MKITGTTPVSRILSEYPDSFEVFLRNGFPYPDGPAMIREIGEDTMLQTVLRVREMNLELFLYDLENAILKAEQERRYVLGSPGFLWKYHLSPEIYLQGRSGGVGAGPRPQDRDGAEMLC